MSLCQWFTPAWLAEALVERHFSRLDAADLVLEPTCGAGAFLRAIPAHVPAIGVEIDPALAAAARATGREVLGYVFHGKKKYFEQITHTVGEHYVPQSPLKAGEVPWKE